MNKPDRQPLAPLPAQEPEMAVPLSRRGKILVRSVLAAAAIIFVGEATHQTVEAHGCEVKPDNNLVHVVTSPVADIASSIIYSDKDARQCP